MRKTLILVLWIACPLLLSSCSPRDFLTRRLAADLISASATFRAPQQFQLRIGIVSNKDYLSPDYLALQHRGWISATNSNCPPALLPAPCWDVALTPQGVDTFQNLIADVASEKESFTIPAARRQLIAVTGIAKHDNAADVDFTWKWIPSNEVGAALYAGDVHYRSTVSFRCYDDGWRLLQAASRPALPLDEALKDAEISP